MRRVISFLLIALLAWGIGLWRFVESLPLTPTDVPTSDAVVVLTGLGNRVAAGVELLQAKKAGMLFISGVPPQVSKEDILHKMAPEMQIKVSAQNLKQIDLDTQSLNTTQNAMETAAWLQAKNYHEIILVTANYHMWRAIYEFRRQAPDLVIHPYAVQPTSLKLRGWWRFTRTRDLLIGEYNKFLLTWLKYELT